MNTNKLIGIALIVTPLLLSVFGFGAYGLVSFAEYAVENPTTVVEFEDTDTVPETESTTESSEPPFFSDIDEADPDEVLGVTTKAAKIIFIILGVIGLIGFIIGTTYSKRFFKKTKKETHNIQ